MKKKSVGIWIRVSTEDSAKGESPEHHLEQAQSYAKLKKWNVHAVYDLAGVSGKTVKDHPEAIRMKEDIIQGSISGLIFSKIARFARNTKELIEFSEFFGEHSADMISLYENIDTSTPIGNFFFTLMSAMGQWEREEIASRVKQSSHTRAKLGKKISGAAQYGYKWEGKELIINPEEALIRKRIFDLYLKEQKFGTVARILNNEGIRTRTGKEFNKILIKRWLKDPIARGQRRAFYTEIKPGSNKVSLKPEEEWFYHDAPRIVSDELWEKVNDIITLQEKSRKPRSNNKVQVFTGKIFCHCGSKMTVRSRMTSYACTNKACGNRIRKDDISEIFKARLGQFFENRTELGEYIAKAQEDIKDKVSQRDGIQKRYDDLQIKLSKLFDLHLNNQIPTEEFNKYHAEPYKESQKLLKELELLDEIVLKEQYNNENLSKNLEDSALIQQRWDTYERHQQRTIVQSIVEKITIHEDTVEINLNTLTVDPNLFKSGENGEQTQSL